MNNQIDNPAWQLGQDYARFGLRRVKNAPPAFLAGYDAWRGRTKSANTYVKKWLGLRWNALQRQRVFNPAIDPAFLRQITEEQCPVSLVTLTQGTQSDSDVSIDRIVNEGGYAPANLMALSQRVNRAKADHSFEKVLELAKREEPAHGLSGLEWVRLAGLMYGAWCQATDASDPYLFPFATIPPFNIFTPTSQVVQMLLLSLFKQPTSAWRENLLRETTQEERGSPALFDDLTQQLRQEQVHVSFLPDIWLRPGVFERFAVWYNGCPELLRERLYILISQRSKQTQAHHEALVDGWHLDSQGYAANNET
ncbi:hypothetical protein [Aquitalea pelogenes]|uniref:hypothetical protein n=1 Tax=Aquitalea pelogenes TaxID=1293573 RepID=UPI0035ADD3CF